MGAGASRKYVVEEIRAATQADVARACAELSTQDKDKLIVLLEASEQVAQFIEQLAATIRTRRRRRRRPIGRTIYIVCVGSGTRVYLLFKVQIRGRRQLSL